MFQVSGIDFSKGNLGLIRQSVFGRAMKTIKMTLTPKTSLLAWLSKEYGIGSLHLIIYF
ncbi:Bgt-51797 [Blumeria graminis f. sp. tritici]|uniref:Bgt-51797 n=1 Tax=Blumeria graminis f. sp. tritici TaxID=62690 RepID=A0A9X9ME98_BLUGR|nr:Bgt-51797 [Blumeria graminis f. sp. tritici]